MNSLGNDHLTIDVPLTADSRDERKVKSEIIGFPSVSEVLTVPSEGPSGKASTKKPSLVKRRSWKKPKDKPRRPLSAYNLFFQSEREKIVRACGGEVRPKPGVKRRHRKGNAKIGFANLARTIAERWKSIDHDTLIVFEARADVEKERYKRELEEWNKRRTTAPIEGDEMEDEKGTTDNNTAKASGTHLKNPNPSNALFIQQPSSLLSSITPTEHVNVLLAALQASTAAENNSRVQQSLHMAFQNSQATATNPLAHQSLSLNRTGNLQLQIPHHSQLTSVEQQPMGTTKHPGAGLSSLVGNKNSNQHQANMEDLTVFDGDFIDQLSRIDC